MIRRIIALVVVGAAAIAIFAFSIGGSATAATTDLRLKERTCGQKRAHCTSPTSPRLFGRFGGTLVFSLPLVSRDDGTVVGRDEGTCVTLHRASGRAYCDFVVHLADGDVTVQGTINLGQDPAVLAVTGGTGAYDGASGYWRQTAQNVVLHIVTP